MIRTSAVITMASGARRAKPGIRISSLVPCGTSKWRRWTTVSPASPSNAASMAANRGETLCSRTNLTPPGGAQTPPRHGRRTRRPRTTSRPGRSRVQRDRSGRGHESRRPLHNRLSEMAGGIEDHPTVAPRIPADHDLVAELQRRAASSRSCSRAWSTARKTRVFWNRRGVLPRDLENGLGLGLGAIARLLAVRVVDAQHHEARVRVVGHVLPGGR